jgi:hypothetical protein
MDLSLLHSGDRGDATTQLSRNKYTQRKGYLFLLYTISLNLLPTFPKPGPEISQNAMPMYAFLMLPNHAWFIQFYPYQYNNTFHRFKKKRSVLANSN